MEKVTLATRLCYGGTENTARVYDRVYYIEIHYATGRLIDQHG
jgi:hypothetical protein